MMQNITIDWNAEARVTWLEPGVSASHSSFQPSEEPKQGELYAHAVELFGEIYGRAIYRHEHPWVLAGGLILSPTDIRTLLGDWMKYVEANGRFGRSNAY